MRLRVRDDKTRLDGPISLRQFPMFLLENIILLKMAVFLNAIHSSRNLTNLQAEFYATNVYFSSSRCLGSNATRSRALSWARTCCVFKSDFPLTFHISLLFHISLEYLSNPTKWFTATTLRSKQKRMRKYVPFQYFYKEIWY